MIYRREIDGLRAIAVIPVILFHSGVSVFSGGFIGVDIFFVISGYLITTIILDEMNNKKFSIINFYERRARRILPALFLVMGVSTIFAIIWMLPRDMIDFSQSLVAVSTFSSNIHFWIESGYFEAKADLKPLLHTWSLAVEEQYYLLFPVLIIITWKLGIKFVVSILCILAFLSLVTAQWGIEYDQEAVFFLLPTRAFELLIGSFVAFYTIYIGKVKENQFLSICGISLIIFSIFQFSESTPIPGILSLVPTIGTAMIILFATDQTFVSKLLGNKIFVGIGLISYSTYLWHQPLLAFVKYNAALKLNAGTISIVVLLSLLLGYLTWKFIEQPFRNKTHFNRSTIFSLSLIASSIFIAIGVVGHFGGFEKLWIMTNSKETVSLYNQIVLAKTEINTQDNKDCQFNVTQITPQIERRIKLCSKKYGKGIAILGDSHAIDLFGVVTTSNPKKPFIIGISTGGCRPHTPIIKCHYDDFLMFVSQNSKMFEYIVYEQAAFYLFDGNEAGSRGIIGSIPILETMPKLSVNKMFVDVVKAYLLNLSQYTPVIWFGPRIEPHISSKIILSTGCDGVFKLRKNQDKNFHMLDSYIMKSLMNTNIRFVSQNKLFHFNFKKDFMNCDTLFWSDSDHFSAAGEKMFGLRVNLLESFHSK